ncbi:unnamed protein product [Ambrosiozyma monospora]|uniref:Unnamed protein product n=1 Tax=Ambrosiozyma monospora TaxID=43982 RepID=A0A9W6Z880_AMBMO|nr:unnamed protein product [Ambrosiozyma monospora]
MNKRRNSSGGHCCLKTGRKLKHPFCFEFPETIPSNSGRDIELPSSCANLGKFGDNQATITISYETFIRVTYNTPFFKNTKSMEYFHRLNYQGGCYSSGTHHVSLSDWDADGVSSSAVFKENLDAGHLVLNENEMTHCMTQVHAHGETTSSGVKKNVTNKNKNKRKKKRPSQDIKLKITLTIPQIFNICSSLSDIPIRIECPDIKKLIPEDELSELNTTQLGLFEIEEVSVRLFHHMYIRTNQRDFQYDLKSTLFSKEFGMYDKPSFDINDFQFNTDRQCYCLSTTLSSLIGETHKFSDDLTSPILGNVNLPNYFMNVNNLSFKIVLSNSHSQLQNLKLKKFKLNVKRNIHCDDPDLESVGNLSEFFLLPAYSSAYFPVGLTDVEEPTPPYQEFDDSVIQPPVYHAGTTCV